MELSYNRRQANQRVVRRKAAMLICAMILSDIQDGAEDTAQTIEQLSAYYANGDTALENAVMFTFAEII